MHSGLVHVREKEENYNRVQIKSKSGIRTAKKKGGGDQLLVSTLVINFAITSNHQYFLAPVINTNY